MANEILNVKALSRRFFGEWVLVADPKTSVRTGKVISGRLLAHSPSRDELYDAAISLKPKNFAVLCFKEMEPELRFSSCPGFISRRRPISLPCSIAGPRGTGKLNSAFDTGAAITVLDAKILKALGYDPSAAADFTYLTTASGIVRAPIVVVQSFDAIGVQRTEFTIAVHSLPANATFEGLLGTDFMTDLIVVLNFKKMWIEVKS